jgi:formylglycine-generating enzyme required for sulfatase activity
LKGPHTKVCLASITLIAGLAHAQVDPASGIDFVTIGALGNEPIRSRVSPLDGRGSVNYQYAIGRMEITTTQWVEYLNAVFDRPANDMVDFRSRPRTSGVVSTTPINRANPDAFRWNVRQGGDLIPVGGIAWRAAAMYCNWLHNDKQMTRESFYSGAYDIFNTTNSIARLPGARYFIPTHDEWLKAAHYDPQRQNADGSVGGWWNYSNGSDQAFVGGPPGALVGGQLATANTGWRVGDYGDGNGDDLLPWTIPLGSYPTVTSPWGLLDVAGGMSEWTETAVTAGGNTGVAFDGSQHSLFADSGDIVDRLNGFGSLQSLDGVAGSYQGLGLRLGMAIPSPSVAWLVGFAGAFGLRRRR